MSIALTRTMVVVVLLLLSLHMQCCVYVFEKTYEDNERDKERR